MEKIPVPAQNRPWVLILNRFGDAAKLAALFPGNHHTVNPQCGSGKRATEFKIVTDFRDVVENIFEISGNRDFFHRVSKFAILDPQSTGAPGKVTGNHVHAETEKLEDIEPLFDVANNLLRRALAFLQKEISRADARGSSQAARSVT